MRLRTPADIGALVRDRRRRASLTQADLAARAKVSQRWLAALEAGKPGAEVGLVLRVLDTLGVDLRTHDRRRDTADGGFDLDELIAEYEPGVP